MTRTLDGLDSRSIEAQVYLLAPMSRRAHTNTRIEILALNKGEFERYNTADRRAILPLPLGS